MNKDKNNYKPLEGASNKDIDDNKEGYPRYPKS